MTRVELVFHYFLLAILIVVAFCVPYHFIPIGSFIEEFIAGGVAVIGGSIAWACMPKNRELSLGVVLWLIWGVVLLISFLAAEYSMASSGYWALIYWFVGLMSAVWFSRFSGGISIGNILVCVALLFVFSGLVQSILGVAKYYGLLRYYWIYEAGTRRFPGLINHFNITASVLLIGAASAVYLYIKSKIGKFFLGFVVYAFSFSAVLTGTRSIILYVFVIFVLGCIYGVFGVDIKKQKERIWMSFLVVLVSAILAIITVRPIDRLMESLSPPDLARPSLEDSLFNRDLTTPGLRISEAKKIFFGIDENLWFGVGPGNYSAYSYIWDDYFEDAVREGSLPTHSHNLFTMIFAEEGLVGLLVIFAFVLWFIRRLFLKEKTAEWFWLASFLGVIFVYSNVEYPLWYMQYMVVFIGVCSLVLPKVRFALDSRLLSYSLSVSVFLVFLFLGLNIFSGYWSLVQADSRETWDADTVQVVRSWQGDSLLGPYATLLAYQRLLPAADEYQSEMDLVERMMKWRPHNLVLARKIELLVLKGDIEKACEVSEKAIRFYKSVYVKLDADIPLIEKYRGIDASDFRVCMEEALARYHSSPDMYIMDRR